jgi:hypothetical protein
VENEWSVCSDTFGRGDDDNYYDDGVDDYDDDDDDDDYFCVHVDLENEEHAM